MKKLFPIQFILIISLFLSGCRQKCAVTPLVRGISFTCTVQYYNELYEGAVSVAKNGDTDIEITSPEGLAGLKLHFKGDALTAEYSGLNYNASLSEMPEGMAFTCLYEILRDTKGGEVSLENDKYFTESKSGSRRYRLYLGATGLPISAEEPSSGFSAEFKKASVN